MPIVLSRIPAWAWTVAGMAGAVVLSMLARAGGVSPLWGLVLTMIWVVPCMTLGWVRLDETAREAHKFAWWWGGSCALGAVVLPVVAMPFLSGVPDQLTAILQAQHRGGPPEAVAFAKGVQVAVLAQFVGYALVWGAWWLKKR